MLVRIAFVNLIVCQRVATLNDIHITQKRLDQHQFFSFELINSLLFCVCWIKPKTLTKTTTMTTLLRLHFVGKNTDITYHDLKNNNKEFVCFIFEEKKREYNKYTVKAKLMPSRKKPNQPTTELKAQKRSIFHSKYSIIAYFHKHSSHLNINAFGFSSSFRYMFYFHGICTVYVCYVAKECPQNRFFSFSIIYYCCCF